MNRDSLKDVFDDDGKGGKQKHTGHDREQNGSGSVTSPLPTLPAVEIPTLTGSDQNQAGGNNSHKLLKEFLTMTKEEGNPTTGRTESQLPSPLI